MKSSVKRRLLDDLEASTSKIVKKSKTAVDKMAVAVTTPVAKSTNKNQKGKNLNSKRSIIAKGKTTTQVLKGKNNNATLLDIGRYKLSKNRESNGTDRLKNKVVPIIQTRGMKAKFAKNAIEKQTQPSRKQQMVDFVNKKDKLSNIDNLTSTEFADGDSILDGDISNDGVELSINGLDIDEDFPETENNTNTAEVDADIDTVEDIELGELSSSGDDDDQDLSCRRVVSSKVVQVDKCTSQPQSSQHHKISSPSRFDKFSHLRHDPEFKDFLDEMIDSRMSHSRQGTKSSSYGRNVAEQHIEDTNTRQAKSKTSKGHKGIVNDQVHEQQHEPQIVRVINTVKSPSDTIIYSPALRKMSQDRHDSDAALIDKISDFVENIKLDRCRHDHHQENNDGRNSRNLKSPQASTSRRNSTHAAVGNCNEDGPEVNTDNLLLQAEKFKARVEAPKGNFTELLMPYDYDKLRNKFVKPEGLAPLDSKILFLRNFDQDDEFFHVTSQIDPSLRLRIEWGEFIDLERLLPRDRTMGRSNSGNDDLNKQLYQLITQGTNNYIEPPVPKTGKINSIRKWDQAFRVFAAIYTHANPARASKIWQYVYVIHTATAANPWENVYYYDINFRELMASKPWRSWGKTYTQGWNMAFNDGNMSTSNVFGGNSNSINGHSSSSSKSWKDDCCWCYNKNRCKRTAAECNYEHRCTYCAGWNHSFVNCRKRQGKMRRSSSNKTSNSPKTKHDKN